MEILKVEDLSFKYPDCGEPAVKNVSFSIERGEFTVLCGATGSGKSTLLRMLKPQLTPLGEFSGEICFNGQSLAGLDAKTSAAAVGFVMQKPEQQIVTDKVWHELAFGLENLGVPQETIAARVAEMANSFGMTEWFSSDVSTLSGGRKQLLNLASVLVMRPDLLILDEPTAQLDPVAATGFIELLRRLNRDYSLTIIIAEHRLEDLIPICDRLMVMENGTISEFGAPGSVVGRLSDRPELFCGMPAAARLCSELGFRENAPLSVRDGRRFIEGNFENSVRALPGQEYTHSGSPALEFRDVYFRYERDSADILDGLSLTVYSGEIFCILGGNGSGKSTFLRTAAGLLRAYSGSIKIFGKKLKEYRNQSLYRECLAMLPQDVQTVFLKDTVREELADVGADVENLPFDIKPLLDKHPYDLSGGEQQLAAFAKVMAADPKILLLDEPTKGLDAAAKQNIIAILRRLKAEGVTVVIVTHDVEFASSCADRCALFFGGRAVTTETTRRFFAENSFYTTAVCRMTRGYFDGATDVGYAAELCRLNGRKNGGGA